jgi:phosphate transport system protein
VRNSYSPISCDAASRAAADITLLGRFYERFTDHAVEIGRRVIFQATGETPGV